MDKKAIQKEILRITYENKLSHLSSNFSALEVLYPIYEKKKKEDKVILDCGHAHLAHLCTMQAFKEIGSAEKLLIEYGIHCDRRAGCDASTGSLGRGIGVACGMAIMNKDIDVYCLLSDGGIFEGSVYETMNVKRKYNINNLKVYCHANIYSAYDKTDWYFIGARGYSNRFDGMEMQLFYTSYLFKQFPMLDSQAAHYIQLDKDMYEKMLEAIG